MLLKQLIKKLHRSFQRNERRKIINNYSVVWTKSGFSDKTYIGYIGETKESIVNQIFDWKISANSLRTLKAKKKWQGDVWKSIKDYPLDFDDKLIREDVIETLFSKLPEYGFEIFVK